MDFTHRVWHIVRQCPRGKVVSYGGVAAILGTPRAARGVGQALQALPSDTTVPWWARDQPKCGDLDPRRPRPDPAAQTAGEGGVKFNRSGRTDWKKYGWDGVLKKPIDE
jgi:methylated-DNA-protein-cysteine methyltransferase-like protein